MQGDLPDSGLHYAELTEIPRNLKNDEEGGPLAVPVATKGANEDRCNDDTDNKKHSVAKDLDHNVVDYAPTARTFGSRVRTHSRSVIR
jgi:hypothetical protein